MSLKQLILKQRLEKHTKKQTNFKITKNYKIKFKKT